VESVNWVRLAQGRILRWAVVNENVD